MSVITDKTILSTCVIPFKEDHLTPQGIDLCVGGVYRMEGTGYLFRDDKILPTYVEIPAQGFIVPHPQMVGERFEVTFFTGGWELSPGMYLIDFEEEVSIPLFAMATMHPRSSLLRMGATLNTAIWDAGYRGVSKTTLTVSNPSGIFIQKGARVGHMTFHTLDTVVEGYSGQYQGEIPVEKG